MDKDLGQCVSYDASQTHQFLKDALSEPFGFEWTEKYLHSDFKVSLSSVYSSLFSDILPSNQLIFSKAKKNPDGSVIVSVKFIENQKIVTFVVYDQKISAIIE